MKKIKLLFFALLTFTSMFLFGESLYAQEGIIIDEGKTIIPFEKKWNDVSADEQPDIINVTLYKYSEDNFDINTAIKVEEATVNKLNDWKYNFDVSNQELVNNDKMYKFAVVETVPVGFSEMKELHVDPTVTFVAPSVDDGWKRITPCSSLEIDSTSEFKTVVIMKKGSNYVVWTADALTQVERKMIFDSTKNIAGMSGAKIENCTFISGINGSYAGMTVSKTQIVFSNPSDWSFFGVGKYNKSSTESNSSSITNTKSLISYSVTKVWDDHNNIEKLRPENVIVKLLANGKEIKNITLSNANDWRFVFEGLNEYENGEKIIYTVSEEKVEGYTSQYEYDGNVATIKNVHDVEARSITVLKKWKNIGIFNGQLPKIILTLSYKEKESDPEWKVISTVTLKQSGDIWKYSWTSADGFDILPASFIYKVEEVGFTGIDDAQYIFDNFFSVSYQMDKDNNFIITNTCNATFELPKTGSNVMLIIIIASILLIGTPLIYMVYTFTRKYI